MKVLVTGATGFVGSWLVKYLLDAGHSVRILRRESSDISELKSLNVDHAIGDITDLNSLMNACTDMDAVFHLAGLIGYSPSIRPQMDLVNVVGTGNVIMACQAKEVKKLIYMSSVVAIGASFDGKTPLNESSEYNVKHLNLGYFETKHEAENLVIQAVKEGRVDAVILNPSTIYGPGDAKKGSRGVQLKIAKGKFPFYTSGGVNVVSVEDVVKALITAWEKGRTGERYILSGENILIKDLFKMIANEAGVKPPQLFLPNPIVKLIGWAGDRRLAKGKKAPLNSENAWTSIMFHWFDSSKAQKELDFKPKPAKYAVHQSVQWIKDNGLLTR